jgi:hypothetical protein
MEAARGKAMLKKLSMVIGPLLFAAGCITFPYVYHEQHRVLVPEIDVAATLEIARTELEEGGFDATLTIWAMRDQVVTADNARAINGLYFEYIDRIASQRDNGTADFGVWHFAWAIANLYRNGDAAIKTELEAAYLDARKRPATLKNFKDIASEHVNGTKVYMGDIHGAARSFARSHIVAPGNKVYLQSLDQYRANRDKTRQHGHSSRR